MYVIVYNFYALACTHTYARRDNFVHECYNHIIGICTYVRMYMIFICFVVTYVHSQLIFGSFLMLQCVMMHLTLKVQELRLSWMPPSHVNGMLNQYEVATYICTHVLYIHLYVAISHEIQL